MFHLLETVSGWACWSPSQCYAYLYCLFKVSIWSLFAPWSTEEIKLEALQNALTAELTCLLSAQVGKLKSDLDTSVIIHTTWQMSQAHSLMDQQAPISGLCTSAWGIGYIAGSLPGAVWLGMSGAVSLTLFCLDLWGQEDDCIYYIIYIYYIQLHCNHQRQLIRCLPSWCVPVGCTWVLTSLGRLYACTDHAYKQSLACCWMKPFTGFRYISLLHLSPSLHTIRLPCLSRRF